MKKAVLLVAALVVCSSFAFADVSVGAWGRGFFIPAIGGDEIYSINQATWWSSPPRIGMTISGKSDNVGFQVDFNADGIFQPGSADFVDDNGDTVTVDYPARLTPGDQQKIWVKLFDMLTIQIGRIYDDTLRGNANLPLWDWVRVIDMNGEDLIFSRIGINGTAATEISLAPVEGLYIYAALYGLNNGYVLMEDVVKTGQYGAGYTIVILVRFVFSISVRTLTRDTSKPRSN